MITKEALLNELDFCDVVDITLSDGYSYQIGEADNWVGGTTDGYMCDILGNVEYSSKKEVVDMLFRFLAEDNRTIESID